MTPISPLQLKGHAFTAISVRTSTNGSAENEPNLIPQVAFEADPGLPNHWRLGLEVRVCSAQAGKPFLYEIELAVQGLVEVHADFPAERRESLAVVNGLGLLYSSVREMVINLTARSASGALSLPTLNFVEIVAKATQERATAAKVKSIKSGKTSASRK
jgi:preprotein translocase subunit SecB